MVTFHFRTFGSFLRGAVREIFIIVVLFFTPIFIIFVIFLLVIIFFIRLLVLLFTTRRSCFYFDQFRWLLLLPLGLGDSFPFFVWFAFCFGACPSFTTAAFRFALFFILCNKNK